MFLPLIESSFPELFLAFSGSYLLGSVLFGIVVTNLLGIGDPRKIGSRSSGATNVLRTGSRLAAAFTLVLDAAKGAAAVLFCFYYLGSDAAQVAGFGAILGHIFPAWHSFKGGKGVATFLGVLLALHPITGLAVCMTWLAVVFAFRISSAGSLAASLSSPLWIWILGKPEAAAMCLLLAALIWGCHGSNLRRLAEGEEPKIRFRKKD